MAVRCMKMGPRSCMVNGDGGGVPCGRRWRWTYLAVVVVGGLWYLWLDGGWRFDGGREDGKIWEKKKKGREL
jgi:hypothetical protein